MGMQEIEQENNCNYHNHQDQGFGEPVQFFFLRGWRGFLFSGFFRGSLFSNFHQLGADFLHSFSFIFSLSLKLIKKLSNFLVEIKNKLPAKKPV